MRAIQSLFKKGLHESLRRGFGFGVWVVLTCVAIGAFIGWSRATWVPLDGYIYDKSRVYLSDPAGTHIRSNSLRSPVVIIAIDERSLATRELAKLPRALFQPVLGTLIDKVSAAGADAISLDLLLGYSADNLIPGYDKPLLEALSRHGEKVVIGNAQGYEPLRLYQAALGFDPKALGMMELPPDSDGVFRRVPAVLGSGPETALSLAAATLARAGFKPIPKNIVLAPRRHPETGNVVALVDVLRCDDARRMRQVFSGKLVFVGTTLPQEDRYLSPSRFMTAPPPPKISPDTRGSCTISSIGASAPHSRTIPGVALHAAAAETVLEGRIVWELPRIWSAVLGAFIGALGALIGLFYPQIDATKQVLSDLVRMLVRMLGDVPTAILIQFLWIPTALVVAALLSLVLLGIEIALLGHLLWIPMAGPMVAATMSTLLAYGARYQLELRHRRKIEQAFGRYVAPSVVERISHSPEDVKLGGETRELTILFCDMRGFTNLSERCKEKPHYFVDLMNRFMTTLTQPILENGGTVDKYMGDCVMAFWNAPLDTPEHAIQACHSALEMKQAIPRLRSDLKGQFSDEILESLDVGIGINTGQVVVGNMGSEERFDYTAIGDPVNLAARLEGQCKTYGVPLLLSDATADKCPNWALLELDLVEVQGKSEAVKVFTALGDTSYAASESFIAFREDHRAFLHVFRAQKWRRAKSLLKDLAARKRELEPLYQMYRARILEFERNPPDKWDGIHRPPSK